MKIYRNVLEELIKWKNNPARKPIVLRGARQVGKSYIAKEFSANYTQKILVNLEKPNDFELFEKYSIQDLIDFLFATHKYTKETETFLFIDEIQESTKA
jgi:hypothetical protein